MSAVFHHAVMEGDETKVRFLLKYSPGIRINSTNNFGLTALQHAARDGNVDMVNFLLEQGADLSCVDEFGRTALHLSSQEGHLGVVSLLVTSACANVNAKTERGEKAIDLAKTDQVRALLSQAMLTESFKKKCSLGEDDLDSVYGPRNTPGCRYSLSSASTDSGVYDDSSSSQESNSDLKYSYRSLYNRGGSLRGYHSSAYSTISEDSGFCGLSANLRDRNLSRLSGTSRARRVDGSPVTSILKSKSFSENREMSMESKSLPKEDRIQSAREEMYLYRRPEKSYVRDPNRRRTVTFGETEKVAENGRAASSVKYHGSPSTDRNLPQVPPRNSTYRPSCTSEPPPVPPRIHARNSARSSSLKSRSTNDSEALFRPRPCPRIPKNETAIPQGNTQSRRSMIAEILTKGMH